MTLFEPTRVRCNLCNKGNVYESLLSMSEIGSPDLDTRPSEMYRSTIDVWVQRCSRCGYCASSIKQPCPNAWDIIRTSEYAAQLKDQMFPELANSFLCQAIVGRETRNYSEAAWAFIYAAWTCDDAKLVKQASACRLQATDMLLTAERLGQSLVTEYMFLRVNLVLEGLSSQILVDLYRRAGQEEKARAVIAERRVSIPDDPTRLILDYQLSLVDNNDIGRHRLKEVPGLAAAIKHSKTAQLKRTLPLTPLVQVQPSRPLISLWGNPSSPSSHKPL